MAYWMDWASLLVRWLHVITAIAWIGSSFYFIWLDLSLRKREGLPAGAKGESWSVHGGGFYHVQKYAVAPAKMPAELHWFKYESYFTWLSGFALLAVTYYYGASTYLLDPSIAAISPSTAVFISVGSLAAGWLLYHWLCRSPIGLNVWALGVIVYGLVMVAAWGYSELYSPRAALLHTGALVATWMTANVFWVIIPNQKKVVAALKAGDEPDAALGLEAKQRSTHNNYLTLPVLFMMLSNHYPMTFVSEYLWVLVGLVVLIGAVVRDYFNAAHAGGQGWRMRWQWPTAAALVLGTAVWLRPTPVEVAPSAKPVSDDIAMSIVNQHCMGCHAANPTLLGYTSPPKGVVLETLDDVRRYSSQVYGQSIASRAMPLGNITEMTDEERDILAAWLAQQP
jgi:uncharacterized membrane protein